MILDTNALSALVDGDRDLLGLIQNQPELAIPVIALGEYLYGIQQSRLRVQYDRWLNANLPLFHLLPIGRATAQQYAVVRRELKNAGRPIPNNDLWIAALARHFSLDSAHQPFERFLDALDEVWPDDTSPCLGLISDFGRVPADRPCRP